MDETPSLENLTFYITELISEMESQAFQRAGFAELSMRQVAYLETILRLGHPSFRELAEALQVTPPSVTAIVGRLIKLGYVRKERDDDDLRSYHIIPSDKSWEFARIHNEIHKSVVQKLTANLNEAEIQQLAGLIMKSLAE
jgi:DNA-binding MarR family transcriptional regulator